MWRIAFLIMLCSGAATVEAIECPQPDASFKEFLSKFTDNIKYQQSRLVLPLVSRAGDYLTAGYTVKLLTLSDVQKQKEPLIYSAAELKKLYLAQSIPLIQQKRYAEVVQENTGEADDTRLLYKFRNVGGCWYLEEVHDRSL